MCLITLSAKQPVVLEEDMTVYKMVLFDAGGLDPNLVESEPAVVYAFIQNFAYEIGRTYETEILPTDSTNCFDGIAVAALKKEIQSTANHLTAVRIQIGRRIADGSLTSYGPGFHSCDRADRLTMPTLPGGRVGRALRNQKSLYGMTGIPGVAIVECTIPAGSTIVTDTSGCVVSNRLTVNRVHARNKYQYGEESKTTHAI